MLFEKIQMCCRGKMNSCLNSVASHVTVVTMVIVDLLVVTSLLIIDQGLICDPGGSVSKSSGTSLAEKSDEPSTGVEDAENALHVVQITLLSTFMFKAFLRIIAAGGDLIDDKLQIFDCLVVVVTFCLYIALTAAVESRTVTYSVGYLIAFRLWRITRIHKAIVEPTRRRAESLLVSHRKAWKHTDDQLKAAQARIETQQKEIEILQSEVLRLRKVVKSSGVVTAKADEGREDEVHVQEDLSVQRPEQVSPKLIRVPNGGVHSAYSSPAGSHHTRGTCSLPGTPESISSRGRLENGSVISDRGSNKFPDIVEDTQPSSTFSIPVDRQNSDDSAFVQIVHECESSARKVSQQNSANMQQEYNAEKENNPLSSTDPVSCTVVPNASTKGLVRSNVDACCGNFGTKIENPKPGTSEHSESCDIGYRDHESCSQNNNSMLIIEGPPSEAEIAECNKLSNRDKPLTHGRVKDVLRHSVKSTRTIGDINRRASQTDSEHDVNDLDVSSQSQSVPNIAESCERYDVTHRMNRLSKGLSESDLRVKEKGDKQKLLKGESSKLGQGYANPAFGASMTEEEFREIQRISKLPFEDSLNEKDDVPMTDL